MGVTSEALANEFERKVRDARATLTKLSDTDWKKLTEAERWSVGVTAHHFASALQPLAHMIQALAEGQPGNVTSSMIDEMNAKHARDYADCTKAETLALLDGGVAAVTAVLRRLSDEQLGRTGTVLTDVPPMSVEQLIRAGLLRHIDEHFGSIRNTVGH